jgi:hypothetical protein
MLHHRGQKTEISIHEDTRAACTAWGTLPRFITRVMNSRAIDVRVGIIYKHPPFGLVDGIGAAAPAGDMF